MHAGDPRDEQEVHQRLLPALIAFSLSNNIHICFPRSSTASGINTRNAPSPLPLQTLQEASNETSDASPSAAEEGKTVIPRACRESDAGGEMIEEKTPLKIEEPTSPLEKHSDK